MDPKYLVYQDGVISVGLFVRDSAAEEKDLLHVGVRWLAPSPYQRADGQIQEITNKMGGETHWFLLPHSFGYAICRRLIQQKVADCGLDGQAKYFDEVGFDRMVSWLVEVEELDGGMCY